MRILVVEDKEMHRKSAEETLVGHELTIVKSFDEAMKLMSTRIDEDNVLRLLTEAGFPERPSNKDEDRWRSYYDIREDARKKSTIPFGFDTVLTDMMMPMSRSTLASGVYRYQEQVPYGFIIALKAALCGAKFVAMVTDTNHHQGAMSAAIDHLGGAYYREMFKPNFVINGATVMFIHTPFVKDMIKDAPCESCEENRPGVCSCCGGTLTGKYTHEPCHMCTDNPGKCKYCNGTTKADKEVHERKDWGQVLKDLTGVSE